MEIVVLDLSGNVAEEETLPSVQYKEIYVIHRPWSVRIGKNCALCLEYGPRPAAFIPIRTDQGR